MNWALTAVVCIGLIEIMARLPLRKVVADMTVVGRKAVHILKAPAISDHWKERVMLVYAGTLLVSTVKLAALLLIFGGVAAGLILLFDTLGAEVATFIASWLGILFSTATAMLWLKVRTFLV